MEISDYVRNCNQMAESAEQWIRYLENQCGHRNMDFNEVYGFYQSRVLHREREYEAKNHTDITALLGQDVIRYFNAVIECAKIARQDVKEKYALR